MGGCKKKTRLFWRRKKTTKFSNFLLPSSPSPPSQVLLLLPADADPDVRLLLVVVVVAEDGLALAFDC